MIAGRRGAAIFLTILFAVAGCASHRGGGPAARALFANGPRSLKFTLEARLILVRAPAAFPDCWFMVDTGSSWCALDTAAFPNLPSHPGTSDATDQPSHFITDPPHVVVGPFDIGAYGDCAYVDFADISRQAGEHIIGMIGSPAFEDGTLQIDYDHETLRLLPSDEGDHPEWGPGRRMTDENGRPFADFDLNGIRTPLVIDTGFSGWLMATPQLQARLDPTSTQPRAASPKLAVSGWRSSPDLTFQRFLIDGGEFDDLLVEGTSLPVSAVGNRYLRWFVVTIDYRNGWLYLKGA